MGEFDFDTTRFPRGKWGFLRKSSGSGPPHGGVPTSGANHREGRWVAPDKSAEQNLTLFENGEFLTLFLTMLPKNTYFEVQKSVTIPYQQVL